MGTPLATAARLMHDTSSFLSSSSASLFYLTYSSGMMFRLYISQHSANLCRGHFCLSCALTNKGRWQHLRLCRVILEKFAFITDEISAKEDPAWSVGPSGAQVVKGIIIVQVWIKWKNIGSFRLLIALTLHAVALWRTAMTHNFHNV